MGKYDKYQRQVNRVRRSIRAKEIVDALQAEFFDTNNPLPERIQIARMLLGKHTPDAREVEQHHHTVEHWTVEVEYADATQIDVTGTATMAAGVSGESPALEHRRDSSQSGKDVHGDMLADQRDSDLQKH